MTPLEMPMQCCHAVSIGLKEGFINESNVVASVSKQVSRMALLK